MVMGWIWPNLNWVWPYTHQPRLALARLTQCNYKSIWIEKTLCLEQIKRIYFTHTRCNFCFVKPKLTFIRVNWVKPLCHLKTQNIRLYLSTNFNWSYCLPKNRYGVPLDASFKLKPTFNVLDSSIWLSGIKMVFFWIYCGEQYVLNI